MTREEFRDRALQTLIICERRGCMVIAGSDCHGAFNHNEIGQTRTLVSALRLNGLI